MVKIEVMGTGCAKCKSLLTNVEKAVAESGISAEVIKVDSIQEIMERGVMMTPASALLIAPKDEHIQRYNKLHLVPLGEFIPFRKLFPFLEAVVPIGYFTAGKHYTVFQKPIPSSVLICFEDLFPSLSREYILRGARILVNITNDAWFKKTSSPYQHLQASVFRAVENRVYVIRAANTGISGFIDPSGKIVSVIKDDIGEPRFVDGSITEETKPLKEAASIYSRLGDIFILVITLPPGPSGSLSRRGRYPSTSE